MLSVTVHVRGPWQWIGENRLFDVILEVLVDFAVGIAVIVIISGAYYIDVVV